jgi:hypothetical protein
MTAHDLIEERAIREALAGALSGDDFLRGVRERIAEAGGGATESPASEGDGVRASDPKHSDTQYLVRPVRRRSARDRADRERDPAADLPPEVQSRLRLLPPFVRLAASWLPPGLATALFANSAKAATVKMGLKGAGALLALPLLLLVALVVSFAYGLRATRQALQQGGSTGELRSLEDIQNTPLLKRAQVYMLLMFVVPALVVGLLMFETIAFEAFVVLLVVMMLLVAWTLRKLASVGLASRQVLGQYVGQSFNMMAMVWIPFAVNDTVALSQRLHGMTLWSATIATAVVCMAIGRLRMPRVAAVALGLVPLGVGFGVEWASGGVFAPLPLSRCVEWVEEFDHPVDDTSNWSRFATVAQAVQAAGAQPDLHVPTVVVTRALEDAEPPEDVSPFTLRSALMSGVAVDAILAGSRMDADEERRLVATRGKIHFFEQYVAKIVAFVRGGATEEQRRVLAARLDATWPELDEHEALVDAQAIVAVLDAIGASDVADAHRDDVHALLEATWRKNVGKRDATTFDASVKRAQEDDELAPFFLDESSFCAAALIDRFGAPAGIPDLYRFRRWLDQNCRGHLGIVSDYHVAIAATLHYVDAKGLVPPPPAKSPLDVVVEEQLVLGLLLLLILGFSAVVGAPRAPGGAPRGVL